MYVASSSCLLLNLFKVWPPGPKNPYSRADTRGMARFQLIHIYIYIYIQNSGEGSRACKSLGVLIEEDLLQMNLDSNNQQ